MLHLSDKRGGIAALVCLAYAGVARAHEAPAEPPLFEEGSCVEVVDAEQEDRFSIRYTVAFDDTALGLGDLPVYDAKTHQFFALRGAVHTLGPNLWLYPFERDATPLMLPGWITREDVERAVEAANTDRDAGIQLKASDVPAAAVLEQSPELIERMLRITPDDARVPITLMQGELGLSWPVGEVEAGLYSIVAYIWSPPYNGWAARPGLVNVMRGKERAPAAVVASIAGPLFAYQGRRVRLCTNVPEGTTLRSDLLLEGSNAWEPWLDEQPVEGDQLELCFRNPNPTLAGAVRLRFVLSPASGSEVTVYSPDTLTALQGQGTCIDDETRCCDGASTPAPDASKPSGTSKPMRGDGCAVSPTTAASPRTRLLPLACLAWVAGLLGLACRRGPRRRPAIVAHPP